MNRSQDQHEQRRMGRSRVYQSERAPAPGDVQGDGMRTEPLPTAGMQPDGATNTMQSGQHGEGAATIGNSLRGAVSGGLSGATTTRGGQQGGIGASAYDAEPAANQAGDVDNAAYPREQDLTLGEQFGGAMEAPDA